MNKWTWLILGLAVLWFFIAWNWYTCGIKNICMLNDTLKTESLEAQDVNERPEDNVRGNETTTQGTSTSTVEITETTERIVLRCDAYIKTQIDIDGVHESADVLRLEQFLNTVEDENLEENGVYEEADIEAVKRFQEKYREQILERVGISEPTGRVLSATAAQINRIQCALTARNS